MGCMEKSVEVLGGDWVFSLVKQGPAAMSIHLTCKTSKDSLDQRNTAHKFRNNKGLRKTCKRVWPEKDQRTSCLRMISDYLSQTRCFSASCAMSIAQTAKETWTSDGCPDPCRIQAYVRDDKLTSLVLPKATRPVVCPFPESRAPCRLQRCGSSESPAGCRQKEHILQSLTLDGYIAGS